MEVVSCCFILLSLFIWLIVLFLLVFIAWYCLFVTCLVVSYCVVQLMNLLWFGLVVFIR